jgi:molybdopterin-guanine dinucleotide biosynthesis protein
MPLSELVKRFLWDADIVLAEGFKSTPEPKVEVFRDAPGTQPLFLQGDPFSHRTIALVTDRLDLEVPIPLFPLGNQESTAELADLMEREFLGKGGAP